MDSSLSLSFSTNAARRLGFLLIACAFLYQLGWSWLASIPQIIGNVTNDDTFLYLEFARNTIEFGFPTFDGVNITNGVQPLWAGILVSIAHLTADKESLLRVMLSLCAVLNATTGMVLLLCASRLRSDALAAVASVCWSCYMLGLSPSMLGMENSLHALIAAIIIWRFIDLTERVSAPPLGVYFGLGLLLAINAGVRLDSVIISIVLGLAIIRRGTLLGTDWRISLTLVFGPAILAAIAFYFLNEAIFGTGMPVSGRMKAFYAQNYLPPDESWLRPIYACGAVIKTFFSAPQWILARFAPESLESLWMVLALLMPAAPATLCIFAPRFVDVGADAGGLAVLCKLLLAATLMHMIFLSASILQFSVDLWYHSWLVLTWIFLMAWGASHWLKSPIFRHGARRAIVTSLLLTLICTKGLSIYRQLTGREAVTLYENRLAVATWIDSHVSRDATLASWNAGQLAYFTDQTLINLDGLMNSPEYSTYIREGGDVREKLSEWHVDFVVDYNSHDSSIPDHVSWNQSASFRGLWDWCEVQIVHRLPGKDGNVFYVIQLNQ